MSDVWKLVAPIAFLLTLATWLFFANASAVSANPLGISETGFVFGCWFAIALSVRWLWRRVFRKPSGGSANVTPKP